MTKYYSQYKQDKFLDKIVFNGKKCGFFIDIGAHDGISLSNSFFFEKNREWKGVCVEPNPDVFSKLVQNRKSTNLNICIGNADKTISFTKVEGYAEMLSGVTNAYNPEHLRRIEKEVSKEGGSIQTISVQMKRLDTISNIKNKKIDFISIDTEGNELDIVKSIDFEKYNISCFTIENNYNDNTINKILTENSYRRIARLGCDDVYVHKSYTSFTFKLRLAFWKTIIFIKKRIGKIIKKLKTFFRKSKS